MKQVRKKECGDGELERIKGQITRLRDIENRTEEAFEGLKASIKLQGVSDFNVKKGLIYRENVLAQFENYSDEFKPLYEHLKSITDPDKFYEEMKKSRTLQNFWAWYKTPSSFGKFETDKEMVDYIFDELKRGEDNM